MSTIKVAVAGGTGGLGTFITQALLDQPNIKVVLLTRNNAASDANKVALLEKFKAGGAKIATVDFADVQSLKAALDGVEVVVSAVTSTATGDEQHRLADASKAAGVKVFFPSEFGLDSSNPQNQHIGLVQPKVATADYCKSIWLPIVRVMSGVFIDTFFLPWFGFDGDKGTAVIVGEGNAKLSFTHRRDVGRLVAQIISEKNFEEVVSLSTQDLTINEAFSVWERVKGKKLQVIREDPVEVEKRIATATDMWAKTIDGLKLAIAKGNALNTKNLVKPKSFKPITVEEYFQSA